MQFVVLLRPTMLSSEFYWLEESNKVVLVPPVRLHIGDCHMGLYKIMFDEKNNNVFKSNDEKSAANERIVVMPCSGETLTLLSEADKYIETECSRVFKDICIMGSHAFKPTYSSFMKKKPPYPVNISIKYKADTTTILEVCSDLNGDSLPCIERDKTILQKGVRVACTVVIHSLYVHPETMNIYPQLYTDTIVADPKEFLKEHLLHKKVLENKCQFMNLGVF